MSTVEVAIGSRALFPDLAPRAYLNHAAISPVSEPVRQQIISVMADYAREGVGAFFGWHSRRQELKRELAELIGAEPDEIALGANTTRGVTDIALSLPWAKGDRVLLFKGEFPANVTPWQRAAELFGLDVLFHSAGAFATDQGLLELEAELRRGLRLVAVSFVQFQTGFCMPILAMSELCHRYGAELFVDAIQGCGVVPLDVKALGIDYLSCGSHKWLLGMEGAGFIYVARGLVSTLRVHTAGWLSHEEPLRFLFEGAGHLKYDRPLRKEADVFEGATGNVLGLAALGATVPLLRRLGIPEIFEHVQCYHDRVEPELVARGFRSLRAPSREGRSGILAFSPPADVDTAALVAALSARGIAISAPDGNVRLAPHFSNNLAEVEACLSELDAALRLGEVRGSG